MVVHVDDRLQEMFPDWSISRREMIWLWFLLYSPKETEGNFYEPFEMPGNLEESAKRDQIANAIKAQHLLGKLDQDRKSMLLAEESFNWVEKKGRQPKWLVRKFRQIYPASPTRPIGIEARDELIALFDTSPYPKHDKLIFLKHLQALWVSQQLLDKRLAWYGSAGKEREKCGIAWDWYQKHHSRLSELTPEFSKMEDIFEFLDSSHFSSEEKIYHLEQVKKKFKAQQSQANRQGKRQTNLSLSDKTRAQLDQLAERKRMSKTEIIELLVQNAHDRGMPN